MAEYQDYILDSEYNIREDNLLGHSDQEEEPMDQDDNILEEGEDHPHSLVPAEQEEQGLFVCGDRGIFEDDPPPVPASPSLYGMSQLLRDFTSSPTHEDPEVPARSREELAKECVKNIPKPDPNLDWAVEMKSYDRRNTCQEEQKEQEVGLNYDPCFPPPSAEPIP